MFGKQLLFNWDHWTLWFNEHSLDIISIINFLLEDLTFNQHRMNTAKLPPINSNPTSPRSSSSPQQPDQDGSGISKANKKGVTFEAFKQKDTFICKFCGGKTCKHENYLTYPNSAIKGLNSDWITNNILATQRPSTRIIKQFDIIKQFKEKGINAIFNLQEPGEHPLCGDGIHPSSGFSYHPEEFYENGIYFFNFGWRDMTATSTDVVLKILKQMSFSLTNGNKVAVHCHAGRGRTGLIIAAWMIYNDGVSAKDAIKHMRQRRKDAISKKSQEKVLYEFEREIKESRQIFFSAPKYGLNEYLFHQKKLCALSRESAERHVPKLVLVVLERLETLTKYDVCRLEDILASFHSLNERECFTENWGSNHEKFLKQFKERINGGNYEVSDIEDPRYLVQIVLDFLEGFATAAIEQRFIDTVNEKIHQTRSKLTKNIKDQFFKELSKKEFFLLECFARFFASILALDENLIESVAKAALRVCISLTASRKKLDKLFLRRNLIAEHNQDDQVMHLKIFLSKWIENFNDEFTQNFMVHKSVLGITEKKVREKLIRKGFKMNTYLSKVLDSKESLDESALNPQPAKFTGGSGLKKLAVDEIEEGESELNDSDDQLNVNHLSLKKPSSGSGKSAMNSTLQNSMNSSSSPAIKIPLSGYSVSSSRNNEVPAPESTLKTHNASELMTTPLPNLMHKSFSVPKFANEADMTPSSKAKAFRQQLPSFNAGRRSLLKVDNNSQIQENVSALTKLNIERHYDNFFGQQQASRASIQEEEESLDGKESMQSLDLKKVRTSKRMDTVSNLVNIIEKMDPERQDVLFRKLLELQVSRNNNAIPVK